MEQTFSTICKIVFMLTLIFMGPLCKAQDQIFIDMTIQGVSCPFCVQVLKKNLLALAGVADVKINTENKELVIAMKPGLKPNLVLINKTIIDSGYLSLKSKQSSLDVSEIKNSLSSNHIAIKNQPCSSCHKK